jgi:hypothetical protein
VEHHGPGDGHDGLDGTLSRSIVMMCTDSSKALNLSKLLQMLSESRRSKAAAVIRQVSLRDHAIVATHSFETAFAFECCVRVEVHLKFNMHKAGGMIDKDGATNKTFIIFLFTASVEQTPVSRRDKVINRNALSREQVVGAQSTLPITYCCRGGARS